jgi:hypothetical protein
MIPTEHDITLHDPFTASFTPAARNVPFPLPPTPRLGSSSIRLYSRLMQLAACMGDQPVARTLLIQRTAQVQNKRTQTSIPRVGFESTTPSVRAGETVHVWDSEDNAIGKQCTDREYKNWKPTRWQVDRATSEGQHFAWRRQSDHATLGYGVASLWSQVAGQTVGVSCELQTFPSTAEWTALNGSTVYTVVKEVLRVNSVPLWCPSHYTVKCGHCLQLPACCRLYCNCSLEMILRVRFSNGVKPTDISESTVCKQDYFLNYCAFTSVMLNSRSSETTVQPFPQVPWNPSVRYRSHNSSQLVHILSQTPQNPISVRY